MKHQNNWYLSDKYHTSIGMENMKNSCLDNNFTLVSLYESTLKKGV